jgi:hypothetical protein
MISFAYPEQLPTAASVCESFALDNGAFTEWKSGGKSDWEKFYKWVDDWRKHPAFDWALIPDVIDGDENANDSLVFSQWPFGATVGVPVWHLHESIARLQYLASSFPRIALGSSGKWSTPGTNKWWARIAEAMQALCVNGSPLVKIHGLRMLNPNLAAHIPFSSADSTTLARNINLDTRWRGTYSPTNRAVRAEILADRLQTTGAAQEWSGMHIQDQLLEVCIP